MSTELEIYGTLGPSCADTETLRQMFAAGITGMRLNLSHGTLDDSAEMIEEKGEDSVKRFFIRDNKLIGFIIIGDVKSAGIYTNLIRTQADLSDIDLGLLMKKATLLPFGEIYRRKTLGGVV